MLMSFRFFLSFFLFFNFFHGKYITHLINPSLPQLNVVMRFWCGLHKTDQRLRLPCLTTPGGHLKTLNKPLSGPGSQPPVWTWKISQALRHWSLCGCPSAFPPELGQVGHRARPKRQLPRLEIHWRIFLRNGNGSQNHKIKQKNQRGERSLSWLRGEWK